MEFFVISCHKCGVCRWTGLLPQMTTKLASARVNVSCLGFGGLTYCTQKGRAERNRKQPHLEEMGQFIQRPYTADLKEPTWLNIMKITDNNKAIY